MKDLIKNPKFPLPLFTMRDGKPFEEKAFACGECGSVYSSKESALYCHQIQICDDCGQETSKGWVRCSPCRDKKMWAEAEEIQAWDGPVFDDSREKWFESYDEAIEYFEDLAADPDENIPEFLQPCTQEPFRGLDLDSAIESMCEEMFEDAHDHLDGIDELQKAVDEFNKKNERLKSWWADSKKKIRVDLKKNEK